MTETPYLYLMSSLAQSFAAVAFALVMLLVIRLQTHRAHADRLRSNIGRVVSAGDVFLANIQGELAKDIGPVGGYMDQATAEAAYAASSHDKDTGFGFGARDTHGILEGIRDSSLSSETQRKCAAQHIKMIEDACQAHKRYVTDTQPKTSEITSAIAIPSGLVLLFAACIIASDYLTSDQRLYVSLGDIALAGSALVWIVIGTIRRCREICPVLDLDGYVPGS